MSVPLEGLAIYDTDDRVHRARIMAEYRRQAREQLDHIQAFQKQQQQQQQSHVETTPARPATANSPVAAPPNAITSLPAFPMPPGVTDKPLAANSATQSKITQTPRKPNRKIRDMFSRTPKKKPQDDFSDIRRAMGSERLTCPGIERPRTADPSAGGQLPGEDSWEWYQRNISALPPVPPLPPAGTHPATREEL